METRNITSPTELTLNESQHKTALETLVGWHSRNKDRLMPFVQTEANGATTHTAIVSGLEESILMISINSDGKMLSTIEFHSDGTIKIDDRSDDKIQKSLQSAGIQLQISATYNPKDQRFYHSVIEKNDIRADIGKMLNINRYQQIDSDKLEKKYENIISSARDILLDLDKKIN